MIPKIAAIRTESGRGLMFFCQYCRKPHYHGGGEGHRVAHCFNPASPYAKDGYILTEENREGSKHE